jgi:hypothetical protein
MNNANFGYSNILENDRMSSARLEMLQAKNMGKAKMAEILEPRKTRRDTKRGSAGRRLASQAGVAFSNPFTSELARVCENTPPIRSA